jgi:3-keto-disaccharide hydrolase
LFLALGGQLTRVVGGRPPVLVSAFADGGDLAKAVTDGWNAVHVIARGTMLTHVLNGQLMWVVVDDDAPNRPAHGLIGVQVHVGPPMKVEYRNIRLKNF